jgi:dTDP-4-amino-4,6-dideoxygalactose transaminase
VSPTLPSIPIAKPWIGEPEAAAASRAILSGWVTQGPEVAAFETEFATTVGSPHACAVSSCTTALHLALVALEVGPGDEVIVPSHSYIATANAIRYVGATPVFVDIEPGTFNIDPVRIREALTTKTRVILCVHQVGMPCDLAAIISIAEEHGLRVIEDAACAVGSEVRLRDEWQHVGSPAGDVACFSFHPRKVVTTGDGGMLTTADPKLDAKFRLLRQHGMSVPDTVRHGASQVIFESYETTGFNYRLTDIQAAVGREQLKRLPEMIKRRRALAANYVDALAGLAGLELPVEPDWCRSNWQSYCVVLPERCGQREVMQRLLDEGISTRRGIMCAHREPAYAEHPLPHPLHASERAQERGVLLPLYHEMGEGDQQRVVDALRLALA